MTNLMFMTSIISVAAVAITAVVCILIFAVKSKR